MKKKLSKLGRAIFGTPPSALEIPEANVNNEAEGAGIAFSDLMNYVGVAVAETQARLNMSSAEMATALSDTSVDVIVAQQKSYSNETGLLEAAKSYKSSLPLINFVDPVFYEWPCVRLQGNFVAEEFSAGKSTRVIQTTTSTTVETGRKGLRKTTQIRVSTGTSTSTTTSSFAADSSSGQMRMNAMLTPRQDVAIPKPTVVTVGPRIEFFKGEEATSVDNTLRTLRIEIKYSKLDSGDDDGEYIPIEGKTLSVEVSDGDLLFVDSANNVLTTHPLTNADGKIFIRLTRTLPIPNPTIPAPPPPAVPLSVTARIGFVSATTTVTL